MKVTPYVILAVVAVVAAVRVRSRLRGRRRGDAAGGQAATEPKPASPAQPGGRQPRRSWLDSDAVTSSPLVHELGLVSGRELRERLKGRIFRIGTLVILAAVAAAIIIPKATSSQSNSVVRIGVVGGLSTSASAALTVAATGSGTTTQLTTEPDLAAAQSALRAGQLDLAVVDSTQLVVNQPISANDSSSSATFVQTVSLVLGEDEAFQAAGLTPQQAKIVARTKLVPITSLQPAPSKPSGGTSVIGLVLVFLILTQYNTWTLIGVMEEKSSRVAEVLLSTIRPSRMLSGKVLGIGLAAFAQAALIVAFALGLAKAVGSNLLHGTETLTLVSTLVWVLLGYGFYCWVYAAAGSMAERRDQVQSLIFPLSLPIIFGYVYSITTVGSGSPSTFYDVLAYIPLTAPFAMPVLVSLGLVAWWQFAVSVVISIICTVGVARFATVIYRKSILRTGRRVPLREVLPSRR